MKPELYLRRFHIETRRMRCLRTHVIPLAGAVASLSAVKGQDEFALGNDANILGIVTVWRYDSAFGVRGKQDIAVLCLQFESVERPVKRRKITQQFRKMRHVSRPLCAVCKELDLALRSDRCYTNRGIVSMSAFAAVPLERRADRVGERPEGQACCHRPAVVSQQYPADPRVALRNPEGELRPRRDACRKEILVRHPHETCEALCNRGAVLEQPAHRQRGSRADGVEDPDAVVL